MSAARLGEMSLADFVGALAAKQPVPGGGAASASVLAHAAALGSMVIAYSIDKPKFAEHAQRLARMASVLEQARLEALSLCDTDALAYSQLNALWKLPPQQRASDPRWAAAVDAAIAAPSAIADLATGVLAALQSLANCTSRQLASDLAIAGRMAHCALDGALQNVQVNVPLLVSDAAKAKVLDYIRSRREAGQALCASPSPQPLP